MVSWCLEIARLFCLYRYPYPQPRLPRYLCRRCRLHQRCAWVRDFGGVARVPPLHCCIGGFAGRGERGLWPGWPPSLGLALPVITHPLGHLRHVNRTWMHTVYQSTWAARGCIKILLAVLGPCTSVCCIRHGFLQRVIQPSLLASFCIVILTITLVLIDCCFGAHGRMDQWMNEC